MRGIDAVVPDSALIVRAREALALGALDAVTLMERVCALPRAPQRVAERLADALFSRHADFERDALGRWSLAPARDGQRIPVESESVPVPPGVPATVRARRAAATHAYAHDEGDDVSLRDLRFAVVDVETTGMSPAQRDRVTEIAIVHVDGRAVSACYESLINPDRSIPPAIVALTRITQAMVQDAPRFPEVAPEVVSRLRGRIFVAHNASFDWRFVTHEVQRSAGVLLTGETLCTVRLSRTLLPQLPRRSLDAVTHYFGIDVGARHRAGGDALATAHVLVRLLQLAEDRGATTWRALSALLQRGTARSARRRSAMPRGVDVDPTL
ncbi:MAG: 3'-5' exonuclease [Gemmatimonadetes bacterium]|nr:3'-5' exonuclease [Gemmatimonadota bacterium]